MIGLALLLATDLAAVDGALLVATDRGLERRVAESVEPVGPQRSVVAIAVSPDGALLAESAGLAGEHGTLRLWSLADGSLVWERQAHRDLIYDVAWSPDGALLYTASGDSTVGRFPVEGEGGDYLEGHSDQVLCLAVAPDGTLASGSLDRTVRLWRDGESLRSMSSHAGRVTSLCFSPDGTQLASGAADRTVRIWQHEIGRMRRIIRDQGGIVLALLWTEQALLSGSSDGAVRELDPLRAKIVAELRRHDDWIHALVQVSGEIVSIDAAGVVQRGSGE